MRTDNLPPGVRLGVSPLSWTNEVLEDLGGDISLETCLSEAKATGYAGVETGRKMPRDPAQLRPILDAHGLALVSGWHSGFLFERSVEEELEAAEPFARLLTALGAEVMVYGPVGGMPEGAPLDLPLSARRGLDADATLAYGDRLSAFARRLFDRHGLKLAYHHHLMMVVETLDEVSRLMERAQCGLLLDTGHAAAAGFDYALMIERFGDRITHIHLKDVRRDRLAEVQARDLSFNAAVRLGMFTVPGDGDLDFGPVARFVRDSGYRGWLVVEAEQDPRRPEAEPAAATGRAYRHITALFGENA